MLLDIAKIKVGDRIREDFGNIDKLAENIKEHGLINPITVTPQYELIAGERRLRALKKLGYKQVEVNVIAVEDAEQQLKLEISENTARKNFTPEEILIYGRQLERIESVKADERKLSNLKQNASDVEHVPHREDGKTRDIVASNFSISGRQYDNMKKVAANKDLFNSEDYESWESGEKSTKSMLAELRAKKDAEKKRADEAEAKLRQIESENAELRNRKPEIVEKVVTVESEETKRKLRQAERDARAYRQDYEKAKQEVVNQRNENLKLQDELQKAIEQTEQGKFEGKLVENAVFFVSGCGRFIEQYGGLVWIVNHLEELPEKERSGYIKAVNAIYAWANTLKANIEGALNEERK